MRSNNNNYLVIKAYEDLNDPLGPVAQVKFFIRGTPESGYLESLNTWVAGEYREKGIARTMYAYAKMLGNTVKPSSTQTDMGKGMWAAWKKSGDAEHLVKEDEPALKLSDNGRAKAQAWIDKVYAKYPHTMQNNHVMVWGEGETQQFAVFELTPSFSKRGAVEVKWFQAYPLRQGVGSRAMQELQALAREDGITLTLFPWDKGQVSQAKLTKFYRGQGFKPVAKGGKSMYWEPNLQEGMEKEYYMEEGCGIYAVAMSLNNTGSQIYIISNKHGESWSSTFPYEVTHVFVNLPDKSTVDVKGNRSPEDMARDFGLTKGDYSLKGPFTPKDFFRRFMGNSDSKPLYGTIKDVKEVQHLLSTKNNKPELDEAELDPSGWGATPQGTDVDYFGFKVKMRPSMFLKLAAPLSPGEENSEVTRHMDRGGKIAYPFLDIQDPREWEDGDFSKDAKIRSHEGRNRMKKWLQMHGDEPIQVNMFFRNANRSRYVTPQMIKRLRQGAFSEAGNYIVGPLFEL
jgi:hypothetical protein